MWRIRQTRTITQNCDSGTGSDFFQDFPVGATAGRVFSVRPARKGNERHLIAGLSQNCTEDFFDDEKGAVVRSGPNADGLTASAEVAVTFSVVPDETTAHPGDTITYSVYMDPVADLDGLQLTLGLPDGLTFGQADTNTNLLKFLHQKNYYHMKMLFSILQL